MTAATLRSHTAKDLAQMARREGVSGWHSMRKEELIRALLQLARRRVAAQSGRSLSDLLGRDQQATMSGKAGNRSGNPEAAASRQAGFPLVRRKIDQLQRKLAMIKSVASGPNHDTQGEPQKDRLVVMVRDPYWLHAYWELPQRSVDRARAALSQHWHNAQPVLRLFQVTEDNSACHVRDIAIHGGVNHWYVDVQEPPSNFRMEIGYLAAGNSFYCLARSNTVSTPPAGSSDAVDKNWADVAEHANRIFAMSGGYSPHGTSRELQELLEERLHRPLGSPMETRFGHGAAQLRRSPEMQFAVDAEVIVYGAVDRGSHVTLKGEPVQLRSDGTFTVRLSLPNRRQVIPIVASSCDGTEQRTIILAVERNTKTMEPVVRDITS